MVRSTGRGIPRSTAAPSAVVRAERSRAGVTVRESGSQGSSWPPSGAAGDPGLRPADSRGLQAVLLGGCWLAAPPAAACVRGPRPPPAPLHVPLARGRARVCECACVPVRAPVCALRVLVSARVCACVLACAHLCVREHERRLQGRDSGVCATMCEGARERTCVLTCSREHICVSACASLSVHACACKQEPEGGTLTENSKQPKDSLKPLDRNP